MMETVDSNSASKDLRAWISEAYSGPVVLLWIALSVFVGLAGPFDTYEHMPVFVRIPYAVAIFGIALPAGKICRAVLRPLVRRVAIVRKGLIVSLLFATAYTPAVVLFHQGVMEPIWHTRMPPITLWLSLYLASLIESGAWFFMAKASADVDQAQVPEASRLLKRIDPELRGDILSLSVRDHYVDVTTSRGLTRLLMRFADALEEVAPVPGIRIHRSHWVALDAIEAVERGAGRCAVRLRDGRDLPVSRSYQQEVLALDLSSRRGRGTATGEGPSRTARPSAPKSEASAGAEQDSPPV